MFTKFVRCCKTVAIPDEKFVYLKAKQRLEAELDIYQFVKHGRLLRNAFKFLTTKRERHLVRMQADKNVIVVREQDKAHLAGETDQPMEGDSTEFESSEYEEYITDLAKSVNGAKVRLTQRESNLITGITSQNAKQQIKKKLSNMMSHLFEQRQSLTSSPFSFSRADIIEEV